MTQSKMFGVTLYFETALAAGAFLASVGGAPAAPGAPGLPAAPGAPPPPPGPAAPPPPAASIAPAAPPPPPPPGPSATAAGDPFAPTLAAMRAAGDRVKTRGGNPGVECKAVLDRFHIAGVAQCPVEHLDLLRQHFDALV